jgi:hypothetical protein
VLEQKVLVVFLSAECTTLGFIYACVTSNAQITTGFVESLTHRLLVVTCYLSYLDDGPSYLEQALVLRPAVGMCEV